MGNHEFELLYGQLNTRQREAVDAIEGPVMVIAGPGTGKTKILTLRIAKILASTDTPPEAILALTFTESGAAEMKGRLAAIIGTDAYRVSVTTFHAFCNSVILDYPESLGSLAGAASITEADQAVLLQNLIDSSEGVEVLRPANAPDLYLKAVIGSINTLKREGISPERLRALADADEHGVMEAEDLYHEKGAHKGKMKGAYQDQLKQITKLRELALLYGRYQEQLREERLYDYSDMVMEVARALEADENLRLMLQERHQYILVDEHQDTNNAQNRVIELLASFWERPNLFVVGDAKQAIYRFQGASLENFLYFKTLYPDVKLIELEHNYRSSQLILDAAEGVRPTGGGGLTANAPHENAPISVLALSGPDVQYWTVARHIAARLQSGTRPEEIAVLARDNADAVAVAEFLRRLGVPHSVSTQQDVMADPYLHQLIRIIDAVRQFGQAGPLLEALHAPVLDVEPLDLYKLSAFCRGGRNPYDVMRSAALMHEAGIDSAYRMQHVASMLSQWSRAASQPRAAETLEAIVRESGVLAAIVADDEAPDTLTRLHTLYDMLRSHVQRNRSLTLLQFSEHLEFLRSRGIALSTGSGAPLPGRVRVMTAHKSKGLEFDYVYIVDATDGHWGSRQRRQLIHLPLSVFFKSSRAVADADHAGDEERNLFYVALTRARRQVVVAYSQRDIGGAELLPTQYLTDIRAALLEYPDTAVFESEWVAEGTIRYRGAPAQTPQSSDKVFLNELFDRQGLSVTAVNNYLTCPWRYFYTNLLRIPEAPAFALMYGNAVDRALQEYFDLLKDGTRGTKDDLLTLFEGFVRHQPFQQVEFDAALLRGRSALERYFDTYHASWHGNIINQLRVPAVELSDGVMVNGKIDKVEFLDASGSVLVIDYKTGKPKSRNQILGMVKDGDGNYFRQLVFYRMLLDRYQDGKYRMKQGCIDFVEPDTRGKMHREFFDISPEAVVALEAEVMRVAGEIRELSFWSRRCGDRNCAYCPLRDLMEKKSKL
jgi:DNA helicase-2/ATP-dependent DNA helicase PcrA